MMKRINKLTQIILCAILLFSAVPSQAMGNGLQNIAGSTYKSVINASAMLFNAIKDHPKIALACTAGAALSYGSYPLVKVKFLNPKLISAAADKSNVKTVRWLLRLGANVNHQANNGVTALMQAAIKGNIEIIKTLIFAGANVNAKDDSGWTALMWAAGNGHTEVISILINAGADVNTSDNEGWTPLIAAIVNNRTKKVIPILINAGANVNAKDNNGGTALMHAAANGRTKVIPILINADADVNASDNNGGTALMHAAANGRTEVAQTLINAGAAVNAKESDEGFTALMSAAGNGHTEVIPILINAGADVNTSDNNGQTALMAAAEPPHWWVEHWWVEQNNSLDSVKSLIFYGANSTIRDINGRTAYDLAEDEQIRQILQNPKQYLQQHPEEFEFIRKNAIDYFHKRQNISENQNFALTLRNREIGFR